MYRTAEYLIAKLKLRTCKCADPGPEDRAHCLAGAVRDCCCPCVGKTSEEEYRKKVEQLIAILNGETKECEAELQEKMQKAALDQKYEKAAQYRDILESLRSICREKRRSFLQTARSYGTDPGMDAVIDLQNALRLPEPPLSIECFDISNISGTLAVASMVHFTNGKPDRGQYRRFRIRTVEGPNDFAMMKEAVGRRFRRVLAGEVQAPALLMVDGGKGQLSSTIDILAELDVPPFPVIGLAKKHEEIFIPGRSEPIRLAMDRPAIRLLQAVRDESHRFAITYHRALRLAAIQNSLLDEIDGIGEVRKTALLKEFGSVRRLRKASAEEIAARVNGIGIEFARQIVDYLASHQADGMVDTL
jgi:excinuclease ABC subunit C